MKYIVMVLEGLAEEASEDLGGRTVLEVAKIPSLNLLAQKGKVGQAAFVPKNFKASRDVACFSMLGYDPTRYYLGQAPLDALDFGINFKEGEIAFCCDFVTVVDGQMTDDSASFISSKESKVLIKELNDKLGNQQVRFYNGNGYHNVLIISDIERVEALDDVECAPSHYPAGEKYSSWLPKGNGSEFLIDLMEKSRQILDNHEINRVRVDLKENPANMIWLWGQGQKLKAPSFSHKTNGLKGAVISNAPFVRGLAKALEMEILESIEEKIEDINFLFIYQGRKENEMRAKDNSSKVKRVEDFDSKLVGEIMKRVRVSKEPVRLSVIADATSFETKGDSVYDYMPFAVEGAEVLPDAIDFFNEKSASQSPLILKKGHEFMDFLLKAAI